MKLLQRVMVFLLPICLLAACAGSSPGSSQPRAQAPSSQEVVRGESRIRAKAHTDLGFEYYAQKQYNNALQEARISLKDDSRYAPTYNLMALVYMGLADDKAAEDSFQRALQIAPGDPEIANNYGWFLCQTKREAQSFAYFTMAFQNSLYPTPQVALANAAECSIQIQDYKGAEDYLKRVLATNPNSVRALRDMADLKYQQKLYVEARTYITQALRNSEPTAATVLLAYQIARHTNNRDEEARYLSVLRKKFPDSAEYKKLTQGAVE